MPLTTQPILTVGEVLHLLDTAWRVWVEEQADEPSPWDLFQAVLVKRAGLDLANQPNEVRLVYEWAVRRDQRAVGDE